MRPILSSSTRRFAIKDNIHYFPRASSREKKRAQNYVSHFFRDDITSPLKSPSHLRFRDASAAAAEHPASSSGGIRSSVDSEDLASTSGLGMCVSADPTSGFRWNTRHCSGPDRANFVCQLPGKSDLKYICFTPFAANLS